jgi:myo-inositol-1-phosphate synthase
MNTLQNVYNKLSDKTELAKHEVNLGLKEDAIKIQSEFNSSYNKVDNELLKFYTQINTARKVYESSKADITNLLSYEAKLKDQQNKILVAGKELGIDVTGSQFYKSITASLSRFGNLKTELKDAESLYKKSGL